MSALPPKANIRASNRVAVCEARKLLVLTRREFVRTLPFHLSPLGLNERLARNRFTVPPTDNSAAARLTG
jgi:hypothetical protein